MIDPIWGRIRPVLEHEQEAAGVTVLSGGCDREEYVRLCERVRVYDEVLKLAQEAEEEWTRIETREQEPS